jgi:hypothetical protein
VHSYLIIGHTQALNLVASTEEHHFPRTWAGYGWTSFVYTSCMQHFIARILGCVLVLLALAEHAAAIKCLVTQSIGPAQPLQIVSRQCAPNSVACAAYTTPCSPVTAQILGCSLEEVGVQHN